MNDHRQMDYDYYRGFDHGISFVINEIRRLAMSGDVTVDRILRSIDPQWDDAKKAKKAVLADMRSGRT